MCELFIIFVYIPEAINIFLQYLHYVMPLFDSYDLFCHFHSKPTKFLILPIVVSCAIENNGYVKDTKQIFTFSMDTARKYSNTKTH